MLYRYLTAILAVSTNCFHCHNASSGTGYIHRRSLKVISMSLYGSNRRYTMGAVRNAQLAPVIFPGWTLRFYASASDGRRTPESIVKRLVELGAEVIIDGGSWSRLAPMLWRFAVVEDPGVDLFIVRDADSRLTPRDAAVVGDWLAQDPDKSVFHCIRDHPSHSNYPVSGGLWGARRLAFMAIFNSRYQLPNKFRTSGRRHFQNVVMVAAACL